jgi:diadenosine tetraphosphate (Ap4A) HIT family hydrolase
MKYWRDVCRVGDALIAVTGSYRINYETMCNVAQALHTHIVPRQMSEPEDERRERPAVAYKEKDIDPARAQELIAALQAALAPYAVEH